MFQRLNAIRNTFQFLQFLPHYVQIVPAYRQHEHRNNTIVVRNEGWWKKKNRREKEKEEKQITGAYREITGN